MLLAHAKAWHTYDKEFRGAQRGKVSLVVNAQWYEPKTNKEEDIKAADRGMQWFLGWMAHPLFIGDYPEVMKNRILEKSKAKGIPSRLVLGGNIHQGALNSKNQNFMIKEQLLFTLTPRWYKTAFN